MAKNILKNKKGYRFIGTNRDSITNEQYASFLHPKTGREERLYQNDVSDAISSAQPKPVLDGSKSLPSLMDSWSKGIQTSYSPQEFDFLEALHRTFQFEPTRFNHYNRPVSEQVVIII